MTMPKYISTWLIILSAQMAFSLDVVSVEVSIEKGIVGGPLVGRNLSLTWADRLELSAMTETVEDRLAEIKKGLEFPDSVICDMKIADSLMSTEPFYKVYWISDTCTPANP